MGFIPIFIVLLAMFFLWSALMYYTFRNYRQQALEARQGLSAEAPPELGFIPTEELLLRGRGGLLPEAVWKPEYDFRTARHRYNKLLARAPYKLFARAFGFERLA